MEDRLAQYLQKERQMQQTSEWHGDKKSKTQLLWTNIIQCMFTVVYEFDWEIALKWELTFLTCMNEQ